MKHILKEYISANDFLTKLIGFMFQRKPKKAKTIIFINEKMIHMFFCFFDLPVIILDKEKKVIDTFIIKPWRISKYYRKAKYIVETTDLDFFKTIKKNDTILF